MFSHEYTRHEMELLLDVARQAISNHFTPTQHKRPDLTTLPTALRESSGCFVTLKVNSELQGCIGAITSHRPLAHEVYDKAIASAFSDHRFLPLEEEQLINLTLEVSVLSNPTRFDVGSEQELLHYLENHHLGVILSDGPRHAVFLPQVWEQLPDPKKFIQQLKLKAGWSMEYWSENMEVETFEVISIDGKYKENIE